jgi:hypothetical protein
MPVTQKTRPPKADAQAVAALGENELHGLFAEAFEAHDYQDERVRFDTKGRKWSFRPDKLNDHSILSLRCERLRDVAEDNISTAILGSTMALPMIEDVVRKLDGKLA